MAMLLLVSSSLLWSIEPSITTGDMKGSSTSKRKTTGERRRECHSTLGYTLPSVSVSVYTYVCVCVCMCGSRDLKLAPLKCLFSPPVAMVWKCVVCTSSFQCVSGFVLIAQGFTSAAYHVCPNQATFQFGKSISAPFNVYVTDAVFMCSV